MKKLVWLAVFTLVISMNIAAQYKKMLDVLEDTETEMNDGKFTLRFFNAETGAALSEGTIKISDIGDFTSDATGKIRFEKVKDGKYIFHFNKEGFVAADYEFEVIAGTIFYNRFSVCPETKLGAIRIVLDWDRSPADLDLHFIKEGEYHISYRNLVSTADGSAQLDRDDQDGYGPETVTLNNTDNKAVYLCYVFDYTNGSNTTDPFLSRSKAVVRVYNNNRLTDTYYVPLNQKGNKWKIFKINNGKIADIMTIGSE